MPENDRCARCGHDLTDDERTAGSHYCAGCAIEAAERNLPPDVETPASSDATDIDPARRSKRLRIVLAVALLVFGLAVVFALPRFAALASIDRPLREGVLDTDAQTDACIESLWALAAQAQETGKIDTAVTCPSSSAAYVTSGSPEDMVISCPNPGTHGLSALSIAVQDGVPRAER